MNTQNEKKPCWSEKEIKELLYQMKTDNMGGEDKKGNSADEEEKLFGWVLLRGEDETKSKWVKKEIN